MYDSDGDGNDKSYGPYTAGVHIEDVPDATGCPYQLEFTVNEYDVTPTYEASYTVCKGGSDRKSVEQDRGVNDGSDGLYKEGIHTEDVTDETVSPDNR